MKVFITKYALTQGIYELEVERSKSHPDMVSSTTDGFMNPFHGEGRDWHMTMESALAKANQMRLARLKSLYKSVRKLEGLKFNE